MRISEIDRPGQILLKCWCAASPRGWMRTLAAPRAPAKGFAVKVHQAQNGT